MENETSTLPENLPADETPALFAATVTCTYPAFPSPGQFGAACWANQVWPYGKTTPVIGILGGLRNAWGDMTRPPGSLVQKFGVAELEEMNRQRAACCMPLIQVTE